MQKVLFLSLKKVQKIYYCFLFLEFKVNYKVWIQIRIPISNADPDPGTPQMRIQRGTGSEMFSRISERINYCNFRIQGSVSLLKNTRYEKLLLFQSTGTSNSLALFSLDHKS